jgi:hypothetical protein
MFAFAEDAFAKRLKGERPGMLRALLVALLIGIAAAVGRLQADAHRTNPDRQSEEGRAHLSHDRHGQGLGITPDEDGAKSLLIGVGGARLERATSCL